MNKNSHATVDERPRKLLKSLVLSTNRITKKENAEILAGEIQRAWNVGEAWQTNEIQISLAHIASSSYQWLGHEDSNITLRLSGSPTQLKKKPAHGESAPSACYVARWRKTFSVRMRNASRS